MTDEQRILSLTEEQAWAEFQSVLEWGIDAPRTEVE